MVSRVDWQRAFPIWAIADGRGGVAVVGVTVLADGRVTDVRVVRASGIAEFDRKLVDAVQRAAPFGPLPKTFGSSVRVSMSFDALNPAVGRIGPGRGRAARR
jgi:TonB family protein